MNWKIDANKLRKKGYKFPNLPVFLLWWRCCFHSESHSMTKTKLTISPILLLTTVALKNQVSSHNYFNRRDERTEDKFAYTGRQQKRGNEKVDLFLPSSFFFLFLFLDSSLADKSLQEKKEKNEHADMCQVSVRLWFFFFFLDVPQQSEREREKERGTSTIKWAKITRCILSKS